jgi:hypothetical protein
MTTHPLNISKLRKNQQLALNGERCAYAFCTTVLAVFTMQTGRLKEFELTDKGDVKDWCGHVFQGTNGSYSTHRAQPGTVYRHPRAPQIADESMFYIGNA